MKLPGRQFLHLTALAAALAALPWIARAQTYPMRPITMIVPTAAGEALADPLVQSRLAELSGAPDIPTFAEMGLPTLSFSAWGGVFAPKGTPKDIIGKLNAATRSRGPPSCNDF
jgi:tripartite-type tricarboxylate transporter receptor subunit TctC